eukprot:gene8998-21570_t
MGGSVAPPPGARRGRVLIEWDGMPRPVAVTPQEIVAIDAAAEQEGICDWSEAVCAPATARVPAAPPFAARGIPPPPYTQQHHGDSGETGYAQPPPAQPPHPLAHPAYRHIAAHAPPGYPAAPAAAAPPPPFGGCRSASAVGAL